MGVGQYLATAWQYLRTWAATTVGNIGIADVLDMLIIAFLIYKLIQFLRRSRLGIIARSIVILVGVVWLSERFGLLVVHFATSRAVELGVLALVILFQPEIRQNLERFGRKNITSFFGKEADASKRDFIVRQTVSACMKMARERTGALLVFARENSLRDEAETGTALDARLSSELLQNIFYDKAPLHDGAVIVRGDRIVSAGCVLPLSDDVNLASDLGTRHRAAIGISELSDAVAVVVSEESGAISLAIGGRLRRRLTEETFETLLKAELSAEDKTKKQAAAIWNKLWRKRHEKNDNEAS